MWMDTRFGSPTADVRAWTILEPVEVEQATRKLERICSCEFRKPWEWGFERMDGVSDGKLSLRRAPCVC